MMRPMAFANAWQGQPHPTSLRISRGKLWTSRQCERREGVKNENCQEPCGTRHTDLFLCEDRAKPGFWGRYQDNQVLKSTHVKSCSISNIIMTFKSSLIYNFAYQKLKEVTLTKLSSCSSALLELWVELGWRYCIVTVYKKKLAGFSSHYWIN